MKKHFLLMSLMALGMTNPLCSMNPDGTPPNNNFSIISINLEDPGTQHLVHRSLAQKRLEVRRQRLNHIQINFIVEQQDNPSLWETGVEASSTSAIRTVVLSATGPIGVIGEAILNEIIALARERYQERGLNIARFYQALQNITLTISTTMGLGPIAEIPGIPGIVRNILRQRLQAAYNSLNNRYNPQTPPRNYVWNVDGSIDAHISINPITELVHQAPGEVAGDLIDNSTGNIIENGMAFLFGP